MAEPIMSVEVTYFVHATEDEDKLEASVGRLLGDPASPEEEVLEGHFGNRIMRARIHLTGDDAAAAFRSIVARMQAEARKEVATSAGSFVDEHSALFLRFDKQSLVQGRVVLGRADTVRVKIKPRLFKMKGRAADFYARMMEEGRGV